MAQGRRADPRLGGPAVNPLALSPQLRQQSIDRLASGAELDLLVIGGGVVGSGCALDAVTRGLSTGLVEKRDFASGTSSRSSKLIHGGLRYLEMLDFGLVHEALQERGLLLTRLAPHLVRPVPFLYPLTKAVVERPYVEAGLTLYDTMARGLGTAAGLPWHRHLSRRQALRIAPALKRSALKGAVLYYDAKVDDARHTMEVARTAASYGAARRQPGRRGRVPAPGRAGDRHTGRRPGDRAPLRRARPAGRQRDRGVDRRDPGHGRRARAVPRARVQGHPPRRAARPDPLDVGDHPAHRDVGPVRHPVGAALDHRHDRHRLEPRQGPPGRDLGRHRLPARQRQHGPHHAADPGRRRRGVCRAAAAARRRERRDVQAVPRAHRHPPDAGAGRRRGRQVHDLPGHGQGRHRRGGAGPGRRRARVGHRRHRHWSERWATTHCGTGAAPWPSSPGCTSSGSRRCSCATACSSPRSSTWSPSTPPSASRCPAGRTTSRPRSSTPPRTRARCTWTTSWPGAPGCPSRRGTGRSARRGAAGELVAPILGWDEDTIAEEVEHYRQRVEAERVSQTLPDDASADAARLLAPDRG